MPIQIEFTEEERIQFNQSDKQFILDKMKRAIQTDRQLNEYISYQEPIECPNMTNPFEELNSLAQLHEGRDASTMMQQVE